MIKIYLTNLGKYNEGELIGQWVELPMSEEETKEVLGNIGINEEYEEYFITDSECDIEGIEIGEYTNLDSLNALAENLENYDSNEIRNIEALLEGEYITVKDLIEDTFNLDDYFFIEIEDCYNSDEALGYALAEINDIESKLGDLSYYFDYEKYGRDARLNGTFIASNNIAIA